MGDGWLVSTKEIVPILCVLGALGVVWRPEERLAKGPVRVKNGAGEWEPKAFDCAFDPVKREVLRYSVY